MIVVTAVAHTAGRNIAGPIVTWMNVPIIVVHVVVVVVTVESVSSVGGHGVVVVVREMRRKGYCTVAS